MKIQYQPNVDALYVELRFASSVKQIQIDDGTLVDVDSRGQPLGIEIIAPDAGWPVEAIIERFSFRPEEIDFLRKLARIRFGHYPTNVSTGETKVEDIDKVELLNKTA